MSSMTLLRTPRLTEAPSEARETNLCIQFGRPSSTRSLNAFFTAASATRVRFFGKIQILILVSKNGFCVSLPKSENGLITD